MSYKEIKHNLTLHVTTITNKSERSLDEFVNQDKCEKSLSFDNGICKYHKKVEKSVK